MNKTLKLSIKVPKIFVYSVSDLLIGLEAYAVSEEIITGENGLIHSYFNESANVDEILVKIKDFIEVLSNSDKTTHNVEFEYSTINKSDWDNWKSYLKTVKISSKIVVKPPWEEYYPEKNEQVVEINPSLAFGTGHHETTRLCVKYLEDIISNNNLTVLDVGCGSGILAISSLKLGASTALCFDIDDKAIKETISNSIKNDVYNRINVFCGHITSVNKKFDIVVANISVETLLSIKIYIKERMKKNAFLILSGILTSRKHEIIRGYEDCGYKLIDHKTDGQWIALKFKIL